MDTNDTLELERLVAAARDALTDDMVTRLASTTGDALDLLDQINRAGIAKALPALAQLVHNGDLERLVQLARTYGAAQDALTDEMVGRLADTVAGGLSLVDRMNRAGIDRIVGVLERMAATGALERLDATVERLASGMELLERVIGAMDAAGKAARSAPAGAGGFGGIWQIMRDPDNQASLRFLLAAAKELRR